MMHRLVIENYEIWMRMRLRKRGARFFSSYLERIKTGKGDATDISLEIVEIKDRASNAFVQDVIVVLLGRERPEIDFYGN